MGSRLKAKFRLRRSTPDLSDWGKNDVKLIDALGKNDLNKLSSILTKKGISPTKLDPSGQTCLHRAAGEGKTGAVQVFLNHKADANARDSQDQTPLHYACKNGHTDVMKALITSGASPVYEDRDRQTPLHNAAAAGHIDVVKLMMRLQDAPVNIPDVYGQTPLHLAAVSGKVQVCAELLAHDALTDYQDTVGRTPLMLATEKGHLPIVQQLVERGANTHLKDKKVHDALWYASNYGRNNVEAFLRNVPYNPEWDNKDKPTSLVARQLSYNERSVDVAPGQSSRGIDLDTAMAAHSSSDSDSDSDSGHLVPLSEHPDTRRGRNKPPQQPKVSKTSSEQDLSDLRSFENFQVAHEKEVDDLHDTIRHLRKSNEDVSKENTELRTISLEQKALSDQQASRMAAELGTLQHVIDELRNNTTATPVNVDLQELVDNRAQIDYELMQVQDILENLKNKAPGGPIDSSPFVENERLRNQNEELQRTVNSIQNQLKNFQDLSNINEQLMEENSNLQHELNLTIKDIDERKNWSPRIINGPEELMQYNKELMEENHRLKDENTSLLTQLTNVQTDIEKTMSKLPSIEEFVITQQQNDQMMREVNSLRGALQDAAIQKDDYDQKISYMNTLLASQGTDRSENDYQELTRQLMAYREMVERLNEQNNILEMEKYHSRSHDGSFDSSGSSTHHSHKDHSGIEKQNTALREMVHRLKEQMETMHMENINVHLQESERIQTRSVPLTSSEHHNQKDYSNVMKENIALKEMIQRLKEQKDNNGISEDVYARQHAPTSNKADVATQEIVIRLREHIEILESQLMSLPRNAGHSGEMVELVNENERLKAMIVVQQKRQDDTSDSDSDDESRKSVGKHRHSSSSHPSDIVALREMVIRLKEQNEIQEQQLRQQPKQQETISYSSQQMTSAPQSHSDAALREMVIRLKEEKEILEQQLLHDNATPQSKVPSSDVSLVPINVQMTASQKSSRNDNDLMRENIALKEMIERMKENRVLSDIIYDESDTKRSAPTNKDENANLQREIFALKIMIERLKEQNEIVQLEQKTHKQRSKSVNSDSSSSDEESNKNELAMKSMIEGLREENEILRNQTPDQVAVTKVEVMQQQSAPAQKQQDAHLQREIYALKIMIERLKEQNEIVLQEQTTRVHRSKSVDSNSSSDDDDNLHKENVAMKAMIQRLKEENEIVRSQTPDQVSVTRVEMTQQQSMHAKKDQDANNQMEIYALKIMIERLKEQNEILQQEHSTRSKRSKSVDSDSSSDEEEGNKKELIAMKSMIERLREENEILRNQTPDQVAVTKVEVMKQQAAPAHKQQDAHLQKEIYALKIMIERLKEQNEIVLQEQTTRVHRSKSVDSDSSSDDENSHQKENIAMKAMIERLREENEILQSRSPEQMAVTKVEVTQQQSAPAQKQQDANLQREIYALKIMIERLKEQNEIVLQEQTTRVHRSKSVDSDSSSDDEKSHQKEIIAMKAMIERLREENEILQSRSPEQMAVTKLEVTQQQSAPALKQQDANLQREIYALKIMIERLKEQNEIVLQEQTTRVHRSKSVDSDSSSDDDDNLRTENVAMKAMIQRLKEENEIVRSQTPDQIAVTQVEVTQQQSAPAKKDQDANLQREIYALKIMIERLKEQNEIVLQEQTTRVHRSKSVDSDSSSDDDKPSAKRSSIVHVGDPELKTRVLTMEQMLQSLKERNEILERQIEKPQMHEIKPTEVSSVRATNAPKPQISDGKQIFALKAMIASQKEYIENLEAETYSRSTGHVNDDVYLRLQNEVLRLEKLLKQASAYNKVDNSDLAELRAMVKSLNDRNAILEEQVLQVTSINREIGKQMSINEELSAKNKGLQTMIAQLTDMVNQERDSQIVPQDITLVETTHVTASAPQKDEDLLGVRKEKEAAKEMIKSLKEQIHILHAELDKERERTVKESMSAVPLTADLEEDNTRLRSEISRLEGLLLIAQASTESTQKVKAMDEMIHSLREQIHLLEMELAQKTKDVTVEMHDSQETDALKQMVISLKERIYILETQQSHDSESSDSSMDEIKFEQAETVSSAKSSDGPLAEMVQSLKERNEILEIELFNKIHESHVTYKNEQNDNELLKQMIVSQKERIEILEQQINEAPKQIVIDKSEIDTIAWNSMIESQKERIAILEAELESTPRNDGHMRDIEALEQMLITQKERIEILEDELQNKPDEIIVQRDESDNIVRDEMIRSLSEKNEILLVEIQNTPKEVLVEVKDDKATSALTEIVNSQREHIEVLEMEIEADKYAPGKDKDVQEQVANDEIIKSLTEKNEILLFEMQTIPKEVLVEVKDEKATSVMTEIITSQKERIEVLEMELEQNKQNPERVKYDLREYVARDEIIQSLKEKNEMLMIELQNIPKEVLVEVKDEKSTKASTEMVNSLKERIELLEIEIQNQTKTEQYDRVSSPTSIESIEVSVQQFVHSKPEPKDTRESKALEYMVESLTERIEILESQENEPDTRGDSSELDALQSMILSINEKYSLLEIENEQLVEQYNAKIKGLESMITHMTLDITQQRPQYDPKLKTENEALQAIVDSLKEQLSILSQDTQSFSIKQETVEMQHSSKENKNEVVALKEIVESQKETIHILESDIVNATHDDKAKTKSEHLDEIRTENDALQQIVQCQKERINILESEQGQPSQDQSIHITHVSETSAVDAKDLQHAQVMLKLNEENTALKTILESLKESLEIAQMDQHTSITESVNSNLEAENIALKEIIEGLKERHTSISSDSDSDSDSGSTSDLRERNENLSRINVELQTQIEALEEVAKVAEDLQVDKSKSDEERKELTEEIFHLRQMATFEDNLKRERDNAIEDRRQMQEELDRLKSLMLSSSDIEQEKYQWIEEKNEYESEIVGLKGAIDEQAKLLDGSERYSQELATENTRLKENEAELILKITTLNSLMNKKEKEIENYDSQLEDIQSTLVHAKEELDKKDSDLAKLKDANEAQKLQLIEENEKLVECTYKLQCDIDELKRTPTESVLKINVERSDSLKHEALQQMLESLKEKIAILEADNYSSSDDIELDELVAKNKGLQSMVTKLSDELITSSDVGQLAKDNDALRSVIASLQERIDILEAQQGESQVSVKYSSQEESVRRNDDLTDENEALKDNIHQLQVLLKSSSKESNDILDENETLRNQLEFLQSTKSKLDDAPPPIPTSPIPNDGATDAELSKRLIALNTMVDSLKEENESLVKTNILYATDVNTENTAMKDLVQSLKEKNTILEEKNNTLEEKTSSIVPIVSEQVQQSHSSVGPNYVKEIEALRAMVDSMKEEREIFGMEHTKSSEVKLETQIKQLEDERLSLLENNESLNHQVSSLKFNLESMTDKVHQLNKENVDIQLKAKKRSSEDSSSDEETETTSMETTIRITAFEKIQLQSEVENLKAEIRTLQEESEHRIQETLYLKSENKDLRGFLHAIQESNKIPSDKLTRKMKDENYKLQNFIQMLEDKVDRILTPDVTTKVQVFTEKDRMLLEKQIAQLKKQLEEEQRRHKEIVNTYRSHLLAAVQGHIDPEVRQALQHIVKLRQPDPSTKANESSA